MRWGYACNTNLILVVRILSPIKELGIENDEGQIDSERLTTDN